jgi:hypothetical protein
MKLPMDIVEMIERLRNCALKMGLPTQERDRLALNGAANALERAMGLGGTYLERPDEKDLPNI